MKVKNIFEIFTVNRYYRMTNVELEHEAKKFKIGNYAVEKGGITGVDREKIIKQLIEKDAANNSRLAIFVSFAALIVSILVVIFK